MKPEDLVKRISKEQYNDLNDFGVNFDNFYSTHSLENQKLAEDIFKTLKKNNHIYTKEIEQAYDEEKKMFLQILFVFSDSFESSSQNLLRRTIFSFP